MRVLALLTALAASGFIEIEICVVYGIRAGFWAAGMAGWVLVAFFIAQRITRWP